MHRILSWSRFRSQSLWLAVLILGLTTTVLNGFPIAAANAVGLSKRQPTAIQQESDVSLTGRLLDSTGEPVGSASVTLTINGSRVEKEDEGGNTESALDGAFVVDLPPEVIGNVKSLIPEVSRPHFSSLEWQVTQEDLAKINRGESAHSRRDNGETDNAWILDCGLDFRQHIGTDCF